MHGNHKKSIGTVVFGLFVAVTGISTQQALAQEQSVAVTPGAAIVPGAIATPPMVPLARPSDTIGEAADRQRMAKMLATQPKPIAPSMQPGALGAPGITVVPALRGDHAPGGPMPQSKSEPEMVLNEVMLSPTVSLVSIDVFGIDRKVGVGEDLGNGWRVKTINRFSVELVSEPKDQPNKSTSKSTSKKKMKVAGKTMTLTIRARSSIDPSRAAPVIATR